MLTLATFNVKNLLEPAVPAEQGASAGAAERALLGEKVAWIARMLHECDADVVGLQEIGPPELLASVLAGLPRGGYREPILGTPDARGIRCALLSRLPVVAARVHTARALGFPVYREGDPPPFAERIPLRRGIVHARVQAANIGQVDVLVVHFKSLRPVALRDATGRDIDPATPRERAEGALRSLMWRAAEGLFARGVVDDRIAADPRAMVAVVGDLNDVPGSTVVRTVQGEAHGQGSGALIDCALRVPQESRFSAIHAGTRIQIDHVLATEPLYAHLGAIRFLNGALREHVPAADGNEPQSIDSDHAPLVARFE